MKKPTPATGEAKRLADRIHQASHTDNAPCPPEPEPTIKLHQPRTGDGAFTPSTIRPGLTADEQPKP